MIFTVYYALSSKKEFSIFEEARKFAEEIGITTIYARLKEHSSFTQLICNINGKWETTKLIDESNSDKRQPTQMPEWLEKQFDSADRTVDTWSEGKRQAAGIPAEPSITDKSNQDRRYKIDNNAIYMVIQVGGEIEHFPSLHEAQKYANRKGIARVFVKDGDLISQYEVMPYGSSDSNIWVHVGEENAPPYRVWEDSKEHRFAYLLNAEDYAISIGHGVVWESSNGNTEIVYEFDWKKKCWNKRWITKEELGRRVTEKANPVDAVNPPHYDNHKVSPVDLIKEYNLDFSLGNVIKYTARANEKNGKEDLLKALWYLVFSITGDIVYCKKISQEVKEYGS